jgi:hypothetical protein
VGVLFVSLRVLKFGREIDPHQSPRERARLSTADSQTGWRSSVAKLAALVEAG